MSSSETKYEAASLEASTFTSHAPLKDLPLGLPPVAPIPQSFAVHNEGIYRALPTYPEDQPAQTALVAGANGISGTHMMRVMRDHPKLWKRVYALSRRPALESFPSLFSHHAIDLLDTTPEQVAAAIKAEGIVSVDKVFFYVYAPQASVANKESLFGEGEELAAINGKIMHNLLEGLWLAGLRPKRILLQTGGKGYGCAYGPIIHPCSEDKLSLQRVYHEGNFYFSHEDVLWKFCKKNHVEWIESRPSYILGYVKDNILNPFLPMFCYAAITKFMGKKELVYPGNRKSWHHMSDIASAYHNALNQEWAMLEKHTGNQAFHISDGQVVYVSTVSPTVRMLIFGCNQLWHWIADKFELTTAPPPADDDPAVDWHNFTMDHDANLDYKYRAEVSYQFLLAEWAERPEIQDAWAKMAERYGLDKSYIKNVYAFSVADFTILNWWPLQYDLSKIRKFGYHGTVDSMESLEEVHRLCVQNKLLPASFE